jgi:nitrous oxidase accessory protein NosD
LASRRLLIALAAFTVALVSPQAASAARPSCGATITTNTALRSDLTGCGATALTIGADGVTLDLGGHTVEGAIFAGGHAGFTIRNGTVDGEVRLEGVRRARVRRLAVRSGSILCIDSAGCAIVQNTVAGGGIAIAQSQPGAVNVVRGNAVRNAPLAAIAVDRSDSTSIRENIARDSAVGIESSHAADIRIAGNLIVDNSGDGISGSFGSAAQIVRNAIVSNSGDGISLRMWGGDTLIARNLLFKNGRTGILGATVAHWLVTRNLSARNGSTGIAITGLVTDTTLAANRAFANGGLGIDAAAGVTDGGRNRAGDNAGVPQCAGVTCP